ncbi:MAG: hypothetical protein JW910_05795 [Anaerolineae bacterium]|nr:hypothetical protein [Anaerolineae bacterium]
MTLYVQDTNIISFYLRNEAGILEQVDQVLAGPDELLICPVVWYEVRRGLLATGATRRMADFEELIATFLRDDYTFNDWRLAASCGRSGAERASRLKMPTC